MGHWPPLTPQRMLDACIQIFFRVSTLYRVGGWGGRKGRENCKKISKRMPCFKREPRMTEKYEYCRTVPRTFVQDCSYLGVGELELTFFFSISWTFSQFYSSSLKHVEVSLSRRIFCCPWVFELEWFLMYLQIKAGIISKQFLLTDD